MNPQDEILNTVLSSVIKQCKDNNIEPPDMVREDIINPIGVTELYPYAAKLFKDLENDDE